MYKPRGSSCVRACSNYLFSTQYTPTTSTNWGAKLLFACSQQSAAQHAGRSVIDNPVSQWTPTHPLGGACPPCTKNKINKNDSVQTQCAIYPAPATWQLTPAQVNRDHQSLGMHSKRRPIVPVMSPERENRLRATRPWLQTANGQQPIQAGPLHNGLQEARAEWPTNGAEVQRRERELSLDRMQQQKQLQHQLDSKAMHNGPMQSGPTREWTRRSASLHLRTSGRGFYEGGSARMRHGQREYYLSPVPCCMHTSHRPQAARQEPVTCRVLRCCPAFNFTGAQAVNESCVDLRGGAAAPQRRPELPRARCSQTFRTRDARPCSQNVQNSPPPVFSATQGCNGRLAFGAARGPSTRYYLLPG